MIEQKLYSNSFEDKTKIWVSRKEMVSGRPSLNSGSYGIVVSLL